MEIKEFKIDVPETVVADLRRRLRTTRWADDFANEDWTYGVEKKWLQEMVRYWADNFDWRSAEAAINQFPQFLANIDGVPIHFIHVKGVGPNPKPLVLTHGWPCTFWDWKDVIGPLSDPGAHGGDPADAFDVVVPSLPGYAFSTPLRTPGIDGRRVAELWVALMRDGLGYDKFYAAGGDWGAMVSAQLGHAHPQHTEAVYLLIPTIPGVPLREIKPEEYAPDEAWMPIRAAAAIPMLASHNAVQKADPQTLAYAMTDSPVGIAAWIWERYRAWSDLDGDVADYYGRDFLCTTASIYWLTNSIGSSFRLYYEHLSKPWAPLHDNKPVIAVPTGFGVSPKEVLMMPRAKAAELTNLRRWTVFPSGGHFAPMENSKLIVQELQGFLRGNR